MSGSPARSSRRLVPRKQHVLANAARHHFQLSHPFRLLTLADARTAQRSAPCSASSLYVGGERLPKCKTGTLCSLGDFLQDASTSASDTKARNVDEDAMVVTRDIEENAKGTIAGAVVVPDLFALSLSFARLADVMERTWEGVPSIAASPAGICLHGFALDAAYDSSFSRGLPRRQGGRTSNRRARASIGRDVARRVRFGYRFHLCATWKA